MSIFTALNFTHTYNDGILVLSIKGAIDSAFSLESLIELSVKSPAQEIVLVISEVEYINSAGLSAVIRMAEALDQQGKHIYMVGIQSKVHLVFQSIGAHNLFNVLPTLDAALAAIKKSPPLPPSPTTPPPP